MLGIISIAILLVIAMFLMLIIIGGNMNKSDDEIEYELQEQAKYIKNYSKNQKSLIK